MSGKTEFLTALGWPLSSWISAVAVFCAAFTDLAWGKIFNWLTYPLFLAGVGAAALSGGWSGLGSALFGVFVVAVFFLPMFQARVMGAGDVKLLMGLAAWLPWRTTIHVLVLSILVGGILAAILLLMSGKMRPFLGRLRRFFLSVFVKELSLEAPALDRSQSFPFGIPIALATWWVLWSDPVLKVGGLPWDF